MRVGLEGELVMREKILPKPCRDADGLIVLWWTLLGCISSIDGCMREAV